MATQQKALWLQEERAEFELGAKPIDTPGPGELLVKVEATALNPVDWKVQKYGVAVIDKYPLVLGSDSAGVVEAIGEGVTNWSKGDRIVHQGFFMNNSRSGTFQQYTIVPAYFAAKIPSDISTDAAASVPLGLMTAAIAMYNEGSDSLGLTPPWVAGGKNKYADQPFVVCAASTSVGQFVVQLAKLSGFSPIIATASPANYALVKALGATHVVDRNLIGSLGAEVAKVTAAPVAHAYDAWSDAETQQTLLDLLAPRGRLALVLPPLVTAHDGKTLFFVQGSVHLPANRALGVSIFGALEGLLADGSIKPNAVEVLPGGLASIVGGLERMAADKVSGKKLVARPQETA